jgi:plastocyanin
MKKVLLLIVATFALGAVASVATAENSSRQATATVSITSTGFKPEDVMVKPGDTVTWKNNDSAEHQVVSDTGLFKSPVLKPGETWSRQFDVESSYSYHDETKTSLTGAVHVLTTNVSVSTTRMNVVFGSGVRIFGSIPSGGTGDAVTVHIRQYGKPEITRNVVTLDGTYELSYRPKIKTEVFATWNGTTSLRAPTIGVRPLVIFRPVNLNRDLFFVRVKAARSYAHKIVRINRQNASGRWITTRIVRLDRFGQKRFTGHFPKGTTKAQAWVGQTPGYVPGFSVIKFVSR